MPDRRIKNAKIFKDTEYKYRTNETLKAVISRSVQCQTMIPASAVLEEKWMEGSVGKVVVSGKRSLEASEKYAKEGKRVGVLNFASATTPGGGVIHGSSAQEEAICRCSTLYPCLNTEQMWKLFYLPHRKVDNPLYNDDCIFTSAVKVFKEDTDFPELLLKKDWWDVDVITCAAPNLRAMQGVRNISYKDLKALYLARIKKIFAVAMANKTEVLILGAFGCGAFGNPPELVAEAFAICTEKYRTAFETIEYAVFHTEREKRNYVVFQEAMKRLL